MSDLLAKTKEICRIFDIRPAHSKGQNFLIDSQVYDDLIAAADLKITDTVLEVGPGLGFLTAKLAAQAKKVVAVELDDKLAAYLKTGLAAQKIDNTEVINADILKFNPDRFAGESYKIVANLPYNITSFFLRQFLGGAHQPATLILMLQKEVAERIVARPPDMSLLAVSVQYYAAAEIVREVKAGNFWPEPEVDSAIIKIVLTGKSDPALDKRFFQLLRIGFSAKRKMLKNNLSAGFKINSETAASWLEKAGLDPKIRAEALSVSDWRKLFATEREFVL